MAAHRGCVPVRQRQTRGARFPAPVGNGSGIRITSCARSAQISDFANRKVTYFLPCASVRRKARHRAFAHRYRSANAVRFVHTRKARLFGAKTRFRVAAGSPCRDRYRYARSEKRVLSSENLAVSLPIPLFVTYAHGNYLRLREAQRTRCQPQ